MRAERESRGLPPRARRMGFALAGVAATLAVVPVVTRAVVASRTEPRTYTSVSLVPARTWAIVPGARVHPSGRPSDVLADRLEAARALYELGKVERVLVSGDGGAPEYDEVRAMSAWLVAHGVPEARIARDPKGFRTLDTMHRASRLFAVRDAVVCTQRFHLPRSLLLAEHAHIDAVGLVADRRTYRSERINESRELLAITRAVLDVVLFDR